MKRPSRGERESAYVDTVVRFFLEPIRVKRGLTAIFIKSLFYILIFGEMGEAI